MTKSTPPKSVSHSDDYNHLSQVSHFTYWQHWQLIAGGGPNCTVFPSNVTLKQGTYIRPAVVSSSAFEQQTDQHVHST